MNPVPAERSAADTAACHGEAEGRPSLFSGAYQPRPRSDCAAVASGHRRAWKHTTPIGVNRAQQVELRERRTWDRRARGLLEPSRWVETARSPGCVLFLLSVA